MQYSCYNPNSCCSSSLSRSHAGQKEEDREAEEAEEGLTGNFSRLQQMEAERKADRKFHWERSDDQDPNGADAPEEGATSCSTTSTQEIQREKRAPPAPPAKHVPSPQSFLRRTVTSGSMQVAQQGSNGVGLRRTASAPGPGDTREEGASSENASDEVSLQILQRSLFPGPRPTTTTQFQNNNVELNRQTRSPQAFSRTASDSTHSIRTDMFPAPTGPPPVSCTPRVPQHSEQGDARLVCLIVRVLCVGTACVQHVACDLMLAANLAGREGAALHRKSISSVCSPSILRVPGQKDRPASAMPGSRRHKLSSDTMDDWCNSNFSATAPCLSTAPPSTGSHAKDCQTNLSVGEEIMLAMLMGDWGGALKRMNILGATASAGEARRTLDLTDNEGNTLMHIACMDPAIPTGMPDSDADAGAETKKSCVRFAFLEDMHVRQNILETIFKMDEMLVARENNKGLNPLDCCASPILKEHLQMLVRTKYKKDAAEKRLFDTAINALAVSKARQKILSLVIPSVTNEKDEKTKHFRFKKSGPRLGQGFGAASDEQDV